MTNGNEARVEVPTLLAVNDLFAAVINALVKEVIKQLPIETMTALDLLNSMHERLGNLESFSATKVEEIEERLESLAGRINNLESDVQSIERSDAIDGTMESDLEALSERVETLENNEEGMDREAVVSISKDVVVAALQNAIDSV
jgi:TolA-binding protein